MASKYNNRRMALDGYIFDSKDESKYYELLKERKAKGLIINFELQPRYILQGAAPEVGIRKIEYVGDFVIYHLDGTEEVIDIKGMATEGALLKRKMFLYKYRNLKLTWLCRSLKYGDADGWIEFEELKKRRKK